jgi:hypothetical protein
MAGGLGGSFGSFGESGAPGFVPPAATAAVGNLAGLSEQAMHNRYAQLGLAAQGATPTSPGGGGPGTAEMMDLGMLPSITGGIPAEFQAVLGELQNISASQMPGGTGKQSGLSQVGPILGAVGGKGGI